MNTNPPDIQVLEDQLKAAGLEARALVAGLDEERGTRRIEGGSWSVAECLDHLAAANRVYLRAMEKTAIRARQQGKLRRGPAIPGHLGRWFVRLLEPPVKVRLKAPRSIRPGTGRCLAETLADFEMSQEEVRAFMRNFGDLDLATVRFANPFVKGVRFSLATGLSVITAHERRHLWQAWRVRRAAEEAAA